MKPKPITLDFLREIKLRALDDPLNRRELVTIPAMPEVCAENMDAKAGEWEPPVEYEFVPILCDDGVWRHKFTGEVVL